MKTYALLVGLNKYQDKGILTLGGCVNDINRFEQYLFDLRRRCSEGTNVAEHGIAPHDGATLDQDVPQPDGVGAG